MKIETDDPDVVIYWLVDKEKPMKRIAILMMLILAPLGAQEMTTRIFQLKHISPSSLFPLLKPFGYQMEVNESLRALSVKAPPAVLTEIEGAIKRLDVPAAPQANIELTIYLLATDPAGQTAVPPDLESVAKQLRAVFGFKGVRLMDTQWIRARPGSRGDEGGVIDSSPKDPDLPRTTFQYSFRSANISSDERGRVIRFDELRLLQRIPVAAPLAPGGVKQFTFQEPGINTSIDVREGQKVVVGKSNTESSDKASIRRHGEDCGLSGST